MEPLSAAVGLVSVVSELGELGYKLKESVDKVKRNQRRLGSLVDGIIHNLNELQTTYYHKKDVLNKPDAVLYAMDDLRSDMWRVLDKCQRKATNRDLDGKLLKSIGTSLKAWHNRDSIESDVLDLRDRIRDCQQKFTMFSNARIEINTGALLVQSTENNFMLRRLELAANKMLLETEYGCQIVQRIKADTVTPSDTHSIERQYFALQITRVVDSIAGAFPPQYSSPSLATDGRLDCEFSVYQIMKTPLNDLINNVFQLSQTLQASSAVEVALTLQAIYGGMSHYDTLLQEELALAMANVAVFRILARHNPQAMPYWALSLTNLSWSHYRLNQNDAAFERANDALAVLHSVQLSFPERTEEFRPTVGHSRYMLSLSQERKGLKSESIASMREAVREFRISLRREFDTRKEKQENLSNGSVPFAVSGLIDALNNLSFMLRDGNPHEAFAVAKEGISTIKSLSTDEFPRQLVLDRAFYSTTSSLIKAYKSCDGATPSLVKEALDLFRDLFNSHPDSDFCVGTFLRVLCAYIFLQQVLDSENSSDSILSEAHLGTLTSLIYSTDSDEGSPLFYPLGLLRLEKNLINDLGSLHEVIRDVIFVTCLMDRDVLANMEHATRKTIKSIVAAIIHAFPDETAKIAAEFLSQRPETGFSLIALATYMPSQLKRVITDFWADAESSTTKPANNKEKAEFYCRSGLFRKAFQVSNKDEAPDLQLLAYAQDNLDNPEAALSLYRRCIRDEPQAQSRLSTDAVFNSMDILNRRRQHHNALKMAIEFKKKVLREGRDESIFGITRTKAYLGAGMMDSAVIVSERVVTQLRKQICVEWDIADHFVLAYGLYVLSECCLALGRIEEAFGCAEEAAAAYGYWFCDVSDELYFCHRRFERAEVYHHFAVTLLAVEQRERALDYAKLSVELYKEVVVDSPTYRTLQAASLQTLARVFRSLNQKSDALNIQREASRIWTDAASADTLFARDVASSLEQLACHSEEAGNTKEAAIAKEKSLEWTSRITDIDDRSLDIAHWDAFPEDKASEELENPGAVDAADTLEASQKSESSVTIKTFPTDESQTRTTPKEADLKPTISVPSTVSSAMGWFEKLVSQSAQLQIDSVTIL